VGLPILPVERSKLGEIIPRLSECWRARCDAQRAATLMDEVVQMLAPTPHPSPGIDPRVARARAALGSAPGRRLPLAEVAATVLLSPSRLAHLLSDEMGMPARRYLLWLRLRDAVGQLTHDVSITEAAHAAGFADAAHLTRTFRRMLGFPPSAALRVSKFVQDAPAGRR
jgi:AraC-like DNA-binding protein